MIGPSHQNKRILERKEMLLVSKESFTLTELLIAVVLTGLVILAVSSVDITSRKFFAVANKEARAQNEAKIAMEHIVKHLQLGVGDINNPGFTIAPGGSQIDVNIDWDNDGQFTGSPPDRIIRYIYQGNPNYKIVYDPDIGVAGDEDLTDKRVTNTNFERTAPNVVKVTIETLHDPSKVEGPDNPKATLTSSAILRAMSIN